MASRRLFADQAVNILKISSFRAENFPYSGPYPWLDRPDASERIEQKLQAGELTPEEAGQCRNWAANGYVILNNLVEHQTLDDVWSAYEHAIGTGKIKLDPEAVSD